MAIVGLAILPLNMTALGCQFPQSQTYRYPTPPARPNTTGGAVVGGATGGIIGAAIGSKDDKTGEGALIGGILGAAAGGLLGNQADRTNEFREYQFQRQQDQAVREARQSAITFDQVISMSQSGLSPHLIINQIKSQGVWQRPTANDLVVLKQNGVSDQVIGALQTGPAVPNPTIAQRQPVMRERVERVYVEPVVVPFPRPYYPAPRYHYGGHHRHHGHHRHARGSRASFNIRF